MEKWTSPSDYAGFNPVGDYVVTARTRDSIMLTEHNFDEMVKALNPGADECVNPHKDSGDDIIPAVYIFRAGHWACGWIEYLMVSANADSAVIDKAQSLVDALEDYPILNEDGYYEKVSEACDKYWGEMSMKEKVEMWKEHKNEETSLFAVRRDYCFDDGVREHIEWIIQE